MEKKTIIIILIAAILVLAIPVSVKLVQTQLKYQPKASGDEVKFVSSDTLKCTGSEGEQKCTTTTPEVKIELDSPFGEAMPAQSPKASATP